MSLTLDNKYINKFLYDYMEFDISRRFNPMENLSDALEVADKLCYGEIDKSFKLDFAYKFFRAIVEVEDVHYKSDLRMMPEHALCEALMMYLDKEKGRE
jgi:hypothetical protein